MKNRNIPFGYRFENGKIIISADEHTTLQRICSEYLDGAVYKECILRGWTTAFIDAGCIVSTPTCAELCLHKFTN